MAMIVKASPQAPLNLSDAAYFREDGYPMLRVNVDGKTAYCMAERKTRPYAAGLVYLGGGFEEILPDITAHWDDGDVCVLSGFSDDRRLFALYERFQHDTDTRNFTPGPVPIPD